MTRSDIPARSLLSAIVLTLIAVSAPAQTTRIRDSVGIRVVENSSRLSAPVAFTLGTKPNVDIGGLDANPENELSTRNGYP